MDSTHREADEFTIRRVPLTFTEIAPADNRAVRKDSARVELAHIQCEEPSRFVRTRRVWVFRFRVAFGRLATRGRGFCCRGHRGGITSDVRNRRRRCGCRCCRGGWCSGVSNVVGRIGSACSCEHGSSQDSGDPSPYPWPPMRGAAQAHSRKRTAASVRNRDGGLGSALARRIDEGACDGRRTGRA